MHPGVCVGFQTFPTDKGQHLLQVLKRLCSSISLNIKLPTGTCPA